jgi:hypothetical protein
MRAPRPSAIGVRPEERTTRLEALAGRLTGRGWIAHLTQPPAGPEQLFVQHPSRKERRGHVLAAPDDRTGQWCFWFAVTAEWIAPANKPAIGAGAIIRRLRAGDGH